MGQGYSITTLSAGSAGIDVPEMADLSYEKSLGNARFMKCIRARHKDGLVIAKVVMKPYPTFKLDKYLKTLIAERKELAEIPNALPYHRVVETGTNGYLVRQYINSSLYDRMSTRPFLEDIEKKWIAFQLLCAVRDCHARNIFHGDIKTENIMVTSWNWVYLGDFSSSFKPTYLPEDNPADFSFFFDTSGRRTCYIAPERFLNPGEESTGKSPINWAMDIFSVGCVIAELFLETPIFTLSQLFRYRLNKDYDPEKTHLSKIADKDIREMVAHMIQVDPQDRYRAEDYLAFWKNKAFPEYFFSFLHQYMHLITDPSSGRNPLTSGKENLGEADDRIDRVYNDFDKISFFLGYSEKAKLSTQAEKLLDSDNQLFPLTIDIANHRHEASASTTRPKDDGTLIFLTIVVGSLKYTARASARVKACDLLLAFAERLTDEAKLDRILPYLMSMLKDKADVVRVAALRTVAQLLSLVSVVSPTNSYIFPEYLMPRFQDFVSTSDNRPSSWVRATYALCLGSLATSAGRFLDIKQALSTGNNSIASTDPEAEDGTITRSMYQNMFDVARDDLIAQFETHTKALFTDSDASVRRALLPSVGTLCVFFGTQKASDVILSHLNTYVNDREWLLKSAFFDTIVGVAAYVGTAGLEEFILPLMVQALTDPEERVVERVIRSFSAMAELGLFQRPTMWELLTIVVRFTMHPNLWIREAAAQFITATTTFTTVADRFSIIIPIIKPYLKVLPRDLQEPTVLDTLQKPLSRMTLELTSNWARQSEKSVFWKNAQKERLFSFSFGDNILTNSKGSKIVSLQKVQKSEDDEHWVKRLRNSGMDAEDDFKLLGLQEYIWRSTQRKIHAESGVQPSKFNNIVPLTDMEINLQNVIFDDNKAANQAMAYDSEQNMRPKTIAEAIKEAASPTTPTAQALTSPTDSMRTEPRNIPGASKPGTSPTGTEEQTLARRGKPLPEASSYDSKRSLRVNEPAIQRKGSAMSLMGLRENKGKAAAEIATDTTNAMGQVERTQTHDSLSIKRTASSAAENRIMVGGRKILPVHNYPGNDPNILKLLDSLYVDSYPVGLIEFGHIVTPTRGEPQRRVGSAATLNGLWRPEGTLVAMLCEHTAAINRVVPAPDHRFFITGSDDGNVKVWDVARLERNVTHKARLTHVQGAKTKVTSLCFVENTHCFVSTGSDGSVHVVKVECIEQPHLNLTRYAPISLIREYQLPAGQYAVWSCHQQVDNQSILILATNESRVYGIELRTMKVIYELQNPLRHGTPTCFCVDRKNHWLLLGTSQGILDLWDLRFKMRLHTWGFPGGTPIHQVQPQSQRGSKRSRVVVCGGLQGELVTLDVEKGQIKEVYKTAISTTRDSSLKHHSQLPSLVLLDEEQPGGVLSRFVQSSAMEIAPAGTDKAVRAVVVGSHIGSNGAESKYSFMLTAGPDWKVRFWDTSLKDLCCVVSGSDLDEPKPTYTLDSVGDVTVLSEKAGALPADVDASNTTSRSRAGGSNPATPSRKVKSSKSAIVSLQQQSLLRGHKDTIMDVALLEYPYGMVVSVDRAGVVYVYS
ncbi:phosphoinositide 3-kinase regulatory subunit 4 [Microthyrium microscopicum]|uniref:non-specific serine/threonine protein kinase n=1 Tax=Microthyrium microscopicum TaxID=703497 RepID=A0A6A6UL47_9PEZI|nr:phosphoinositide 3-kinase regulatory subunit 4 [Microthyrium microscopicum]